MAESNYQIIERTGTPILNGASTRRAHLPSTEAVFEPKVSVTPVTFGRSSRNLYWTDLYSEEFGRSALVIRAQTLLAKGQQFLSTALDYIRDDDAVRADYEITLFQGTIPELFCCNSIGEGFATIVLALRWALKNRRGDPLTSDQLVAVLNCVSRLNRELFIAYDTALDLVDDLEKAGLNTDISIAAPLARLLIEDTDEIGAK
jgi:hypothetical protein